MPKCLLKNFSTGNRVEVCVDGEFVPNPVPIDDVAVRRTFYRRSRPDGSSIDDGEWSLNQIESAAAPLIATLSEKWDEFDIESKGTLAEFFAIQSVRGPRWKAWWMYQTRSAADRWRRNPEPMLRNGLWLPMTHSAINEFEDHSLENTAWLTRMMGISKKITGIFCSMRWTLLEFETPCLALSDHPVVEWPLDAEYRRPEPNLAGTGALNLLEVRVPVSPTTAILMTWSDELGIVDRMEATQEVAANINAFSIANGERQWVRQPHSSVPVATGYLDPLAPVILDRYSRQIAETSLLREAVANNVQPKLGQDAEEEADIFVVGPAQG